MVWNWTGRRSKWTSNTENRLTVEAFTKRFHGSVIFSVLANDVFKTDPFGGIFGSRGALFHREQTNDVATTHPQQHEKEPPASSQNGPSRERCRAYPGIPPPLSMRESRRTFRTSRMETKKEEEA